MTDPKELFGKDYEEFCEIDPFNPQNEVSGYISRKSNEYYGALIITKVNNRKLQPKLIMGTPKMHYPFDARADGTRNYRFITAKNIEVYEKIDGTNILAYFYSDGDNRFLTFKTRLRPFVSSGRFGDFLSMWKEVSASYHTEIMREMERSDCNLSFELYGSRNTHLVIYKVPLTFALLFGVTNTGRILSPLQNLKNPDLPIVNRLTVVDKDYVWNYEETQRKLEAGLKQEEDGYYSGVEGTVWYLHTPEGRCIQLKCFDGRTNILTELGWRKLSNLYTTKYNGKVATIINNKIVWRQTTGWYRSKLDTRMIRVGLNHIRKVANGFIGSNVTIDHLFLTNEGWKMAGDLSTNDKIITGNYAPNDLQMQFINGSLLGDATCYDGRFSSIGIIEDYALLKLQALKQWCTNIEKRTLKSGKIGYTIRTRHLIWTRQLKERWYPNGKKRIPSDLAISELLLAAWYMDDGHLHKHPSGSYSIIFATCGFPKSDVTSLIKKLKAFGLKASITNQNNIYISTDTSSKLFNSIGKYIPLGMRYKLPSNMPSFKSTAWEINYPSLETDNVIIGKSSLPSYERSVYCIDVEEGHNFITQSGVAHNCKPNTIEAIHWAAGAGLSKNVIIATCWNGFENADVITSELIGKLLLEEFEPHVIELNKDLIGRCVSFVNEEAEFRNKVISKYKATGMNILLNKGDVMRQLSDEFPKNKMKKVYSIISSYG